MYFRRLDRLPASECLSCGEFRLLDVGIPRPLKNCRSPIPTLGSQYVEVDLQARVPVRLTSVWPILNYMIENIVSKNALQLHCAF